MYPCVLKWTVSTPEATTNSTVLSKKLFSHVPQLQDEIEGISCTITCKMVPKYYRMMLERQILVQDQMSRA